MSVSQQHDHVGLVSADVQGIRAGIVNRNLLEIDFAERQTLLEDASGVLRRVAQYPGPATMVQMVCDYPVQTMPIQKQITDLQTQQFLPPECNHSTFKQPFETLRGELEDTRRVPITAGTDEDLLQELDNITRDSRQLGDEVRALRTQSANAQSLAPLEAATPPHQPEGRGQKFPDSSDFSGSDRAQLRGWIAQLRMFVRHKPISFLDDQSKMRYAFNRL